MGLKVLDPRRRIVFIRRNNKNPGFPGGSEGKVSACNVGDLGLIPGLGRSPGEGTPVFWPRESHGLYSPWGCKELDMTEPLSLSLSSNAEMTCLTKITEMKYKGTAL